MPFQKGKPKTGGRKKGLPNKRSLQLAEKANALGVDPFEILLLFASGDWKGLGYKGEKITVYSKDYSNEEYTIQPAVRAKAAAEACQYLHPKRKAIERHDANKKKDKFKNVPNEELTALARREFKK